MNSHKLKSFILANSRGSVVVLVGLMLVVFIGVAALAIDIGYLSTTRNELQNIADSAALAAAGYLGAEYGKLAPAVQGTHAFTKSEIVDVIQAVVLKNKAAKASYTIETGNNDIVVGKWNPATGIVEPSSPAFPSIGPDAVYVKARRDSFNSPIGTFFARALSSVFGTLPVTAEAVAALSGPSTVAEGELITPFALSEHNFPNNCSDLIAFSPTTSSCAAWHNFFDPINANAMADKLIGFIQGDTECKYCDADTTTDGPTWLADNFDIIQTPDEEVTPAAGSGDSFEFQGGTVSSLFNGGYLGAGYDGEVGPVFDNDKKPAPILALFDYYRYRDGDGDDSIWSATIPIYKDNQDGTCTNPNTSLEVLGFAKIVVISPDPPPASNIQVHVDCNFTVVEGRGGGGTYGNVKGTIPNLVK